MRWIYGIVSVLIGLAVAVPVLTRVAGVAADRGEGPLSELASAVAEIRGEPARAPEIETAPGETTTVYRWRDATGTIHYESTPPPAGVEAERLIFKRPPREAAQAGARDSAARAGGGGIASNPLSLYGPEGRAEFLERLDSTLDRVGQQREALNRLKQDL